MRLVAICAVLAGSLVGFGATATQASAAGPPCGQVWVEGDWVIPTTAGNCVDPGHPATGTLCHWENTYVCVPDPLTLP
jgi:hypothetical protein